MELNDNNIKECIDKVSDLLRFYKEAKSAEERFNVFKLCRVNHYETMHSRIIAEFLNPEGMHGMGDVFLAKFLDVIGLGDDMQASPGVEVETEYQISEGRIDIVVRSRCPGNEWLVVIENKIYACERPYQLERYGIWMQTQINHFDKRKIVFLTLDGHASETAKGKEVAVLRVSYKKEILEWLSECVKIAAEKPYVRESLSQYKKLVEELTHNRKDNNIMNQLVDMCLENSEKFDAAMTIARESAFVRAAVVQEIVKTYKDKFDPHGEFRWTGFEGICEKSYSGFGFSFNDPASKFPAQQALYAQC